MIACAPETSSTALLQPTRHMGYAPQDVLGQHRQEVLHTAAPTNLVTGDGRRDKEGYIS